MTEGTAIIRFFFRLLAVSITVPQGFKIAAYIRNGIKWIIDYAGIYLEISKRALCPGELGKP